MEKASGGSFARATQKTDEGDDDEDEDDWDMTLNRYRHSVPGYDQPVPPGQKPFTDRSASQLS
jgi:hypothetical protein